MMILPQFCAAVTNKPPSGQKKSCLPRSIHVGNAQNFYLDTQTGK